MKKTMQRQGLVAATVSLLGVFAAGAIPIPLYTLYRRDNGLSYTDLSLAAVGYLAGAMFALLVLGRLSNHVGRRPIALLALGLTTVACLILLNVTGPAPLIAGRMLQGLACGLASSAIASYAVDNAPPSPAWLAAAIASGAPVLGLTIGAISAGALVEYGPWPRVLPYVCTVGVLCFCAVLIVLARETVVRTPGTMASLRPQIQLPRQARKLFPVAACTFVSTWAWGGFYQAFGPSMATDLLGSTNALVAALVFASVLGPSAFGGAMAGRLAPASAQRVGMLAFLLSVGCVLLALQAKLVVPFLVASACAGAAQGATLTGSIRALLAGGAPGERAGVFSVIYATCYAGAAIPALIAGQVARSLNLFEVAVGYAMLGALGCAITVLAARNPEPSQAPANP